MEKSAATHEVKIIELDLQQQRELAESLLPRLLSEGWQIAGVTPQVVLLQRQHVQEPDTQATALTEQEAAEVAARHADIRRLLGEIAGGASNVR